VASNTVTGVSFCIGFDLKHAGMLSLTVKHILASAAMHRPPKTSGAGTTQPAKLKLPWQAGRPSLRRPVRRVGAAS